MSKHVLIIAAGAADDPLDELDGRTPLEAAATPALDELASLGRQGTLRTIPKGCAPSRDVATLSLIGYDARADYRGYAGIEALGRRALPRDGELVMRCDFMTVTDGIVTDVTAGHLTTTEARTLLESLNEELVDRGVRLCAGLSYRALMFAPAEWGQVACTPAHDLIGQRVERHWPTGRGSRALRDVIEAAADVLADHDLNRHRLDIGEPPANGLWPWGQGVPPRVRRFRERFNLRGAAVGAVDLFRGVASLMGWPMPETAGATGWLDTDYAAKGRAAAAALDEYDLVTVHVEAPYESALAGDVGAKVRAIERIDREIVAPLLERCRRWERWSMAFACDVAMSLRSRAHAGEAVPFCLAGSAPFGGDERRPFGERSASVGLRVDPACDFMEYFLRA